MFRLIADNNSHNGSGSKADMAEVSLIIDLCISWSLTNRSFGDDLLQLLDRHVIAIDPASHDVRGILHGLRVGELP